MRRSRLKRNFPVWVCGIVALFLVLFILIGSGTDYYYATFGATLSNTLGQIVARSAGDSNAGNTVGNGGDILGGNRINILLLGSDTDQKFNGSYLAQTDIVVTINPKTRQVSMLSIPRDTWLNAPGYGMMKLDQVYQRGGVALSRYTIHQDFGIYIDYYAWVGLNGFIKVIDTVGGINVDVLHPITDDTYPNDIGNSGQSIYSMKRLYLAPGPQHLSGSEALEYVRSRHADLIGDFGRSVRQQQVLTQLKNKLDNSAIISQLPALANDLNGYVKTDMQLPDVLRLMSFARTLNSSKIQRVTLGPPYSSTANINTALGVQSVVLLNCGQVQPVIASMFDLGANAKCDLQSGSTGSTNTSARAAQASTNVTWKGELSSSTSALTEAASCNCPGPQSLVDPMLNLRNNSISLSGVHSLLDLMFFVVFESPQAVKV